MMKILYFIPARGGSKRFPGKNVYKFRGKPLLLHSIDHARGMTTDENICLSTDRHGYKEIAEDYGLTVKFIRPKEIATDESPTRDSILHALNYYKGYDAVCILQPTSPIRDISDTEKAIMIYEETVNQDGPCDAVISSNDHKTPNGVTYLVNIESLKKCDIPEMKNVIMFKSKTSLDINFIEDIKDL